MSAELTDAVGFAAAAAAALIATPVAISIARRTDFFDHPRGYRQHGGPTPLLGGAAVLVAVAVAVAAIGASTGLLVALGCAARIIGYALELGASRAAGGIAGRRRDACVAAAHVLCGAAPRATAVS